MKCKEKRSEQKKMAEEKQLLEQLNKIENRNYLLEKKKKWHCIKKKKIN